MTTLPTATEKKLGLVIDLDICVGCHACAVACKSWNSTGTAAPLSDMTPYGAEAQGTWLNRIHAFDVDDGEGGFTLHFPRSCLHCDNAPCVTVCPTGASYKRAKDGIVLVDEDLCIGCGLCAWACPYGARELDDGTGTMKKCTLCADRIDNSDLVEEDRVPACVRTCPTSARHFGDLADPSSDVSRLVVERGGVTLMPESGAEPVNRYLPPRSRHAAPSATMTAGGNDEAPDGFLGWLDRVLSD
ncbi:MAG: 4Fe-4S dicluster domain-containing protein [Rhodospirillales bacterium]|nr:4Fe-4S dicluster domain-containing protein [Rhodospirillales bacterium]